jgi:hypothetical protein
VSNFKLYKTTSFQVNTEIIPFRVGVIRLGFKLKYKVMKAELTWSLNIFSFVALEGRASRSIKPLHSFPFTLLLCGIKTWWVGK